MGKYKRQKRPENGLCTVPGCFKPFLAKGMCNMHWWRVKRYGDPNFTSFNFKCKVEGCGRKHRAKGWCSKHFEQHRRSSGYHATAQRKPKTRYTDCLRYAKKRGLEWTIPFEIFLELISKCCTYCQGPLPQTRAGLDRKDNAMGYTIDNVTPCCTDCNATRSNNFSYEEFLEFSKTDLFKRIIERRKVKRIV